MPKPIPYPYQQNSRRLWLPYHIAIPALDPLPNCLLYNKRWGRRDWYVPNTRRYRKLVRRLANRAGAASRPSYDLCYDPTLPLGIMDTLGDHITEVVTRATAITPPAEDK